MTRVLAALVIALLALLGTPGTAGAQVVPDVIQDAIPTPDCQEAPIPERPGTGIAGWIDPGPKTPPPAADPWAANPTTSVYEQYGYAGLRWDTYDLGCGGSTRRPDAAAGNAVGNFILGVPKSLIALAVTMSRHAYQPDWLQVFDPLIVNVTTSLKRSFFDPWIGLAVVGLGLVIAWRARRAHLASALTAVAAALFVMVVAAGVFNYPVQASHVTDGTVAAVLGPVNAGLSGQAASGSADPAGKVAANLHNVVYGQMMRGMLGSDNSETARKWGPSLFRAKAISWEEDRLTGADREAMLTFKRTLWTTTAEAIKTEDPDAYAYLTGKRSEARGEAAIIAAIGAAVAVPFPIISDLLIIVSYLIVRLGVMVAPLIATLAVFPAFLLMALGVVRTIGAALVNVVAFGVGSAITIAGIVLLLDPNSALPEPLALLLVGLLGLVMWFVLKPFRRLTQMVKGSDPFTDATSGTGDRIRGAGKFVKRTAIAVGTSGLGSYVGTKEALEDEREESTPSAAPRAEATSRPEETTPAVPVASTTTSAQPPTRAAIEAAPVPGARPHGAGSADGQHALPPVTATPEMRAAEEAHLAEAARRQSATPEMLLAEEAHLAAAIERLTAAIEGGGGLYRPSALPVAEDTPTQPPAPAPPPVEPEVIDGDEVFILYRPSGVEVTPAGTDADA